jgi:hypothetical protein
MPKEKNYNPVQAQRKADKAREIKKGTSRLIVLWEQRKRTISGRGLTSGVPSNRKGRSAKPSQ